MIWLARLLLYVPAIIAGWLVAEGTASYWVIAAVIGLVLLALSSALYIYLPYLRNWWSTRNK